QRVGEREAVRAADLHHPFHPDIPQRDVIDQRPVLGGQVVVIRGQVHVVIHVVRCAAPPQRRLEKRRLPVPRAEVQGAGGHLWDAPAPTPPRPPPPLLPPAFARGPPAPPLRACPRLPLGLNDCSDRSIAQVRSPRLTGLSVCGW